MDWHLFFVILIILIAFFFDIANGFHDAANSISTVVSTRVLRPRTAVLWAAFFNFAAMLVFTPAVANTISKIVYIQPNDPTYLDVVLAGLAGAIVWDLFTWRLGLPTSSSHALIGGVSGAGLAYAGAGALRWDLLWKTVQFIFIAPLLGLVIAVMLITACYWIFRKYKPACVDGIFRKGQLFSAALYSLGHGGNDAQKTMGVILAVMIASGYLSEDAKLSLFSPSTVWIILLSHLAMAIGTAFGGWRIVRTMGMKITKLKPMGGFCAESAGAFTLFLATFGGIPVSTTHTITGAILGVGSVTTKFSKIKWGVATKIVWAWILTIPAAAFFAALLFNFIRILRG